MVRRDRLLCMCVIFTCLVFWISYRLYWLLQCEDARDKKMRDATKELGATVFSTMTHYCLMTHYVVVTHYWEEVCRRL